jgi:DNA-binding HxlR family transcriptional regulator
MPPVPPPKRHPYDQWAPDARALDLVGDKWTLLIVRDLAGGPRRFVELQRVLPGISTEQLRSRLNRMVADGLLTRQRYREVPPRVDYELTERARDLMPVLGALAAWGYEWAWSRPREGEAVDIGAILRVAPGLVQLPSSTSGTVACTVTDSDRAHDHLLTIDRGRVSIQEREAPDAKAQVSGSQQQWVEALAPNGSVDALSISGERRLAEALLAALRSEADGRAAAAA